MRINRQDFAPAPPKPPPYQTADPGDLDDLVALRMGAPEVEDDVDAEEGEDEASAEGEAELENA